MRQRALICVVILVFLKIAFVNAQMPNLDLSKTVNTATGEMAFSMPLGVVKGINGRDFPINLNYQAGIRLHQDASPAGLGFDLSAGTITRKTVFVADQNAGGDGKYNIRSLDQTCDPDWWVKLIKGVLIVISVVVGFFTGGAGLIISSFVSFASFAFNVMLASPRDYIAGGLHNPSYHHEVDKGAGYLTEGSASDLPDIYFVSTPYISGQIVVTPNKTYKFVTPGTGTTNVKITYDNNAFKLLLPDGTRLLFEKYDLTDSRTGVWGSKRVNNNSDCHYGTAIEQTEQSINQWYLTKVLFPDYTGSENDLQSADPGTWISFNYIPLFTEFKNSPPLQELCTGLFSVCQRSPREAGENYTMLRTSQLLTGINTSNENAMINYVFDRLDNAPSKIETNVITYLVPFLMPRIDNITIRYANGDIRRKIDFKTDYILRPKTIGSRSAADQLPIGPPGSAGTVYPSNEYYYASPATGQAIRDNPIRRRVPLNPNNASLTLQQISITENGVALPKTTFKYTDYNPELSRIDNVSVPRGPVKPRFTIEDQDYWGYYNPSGANNGTSNDFNLYGYGSKAEITPGGRAYAEAWSLRSIDFADGKRITWEYEAQRYATANGAEVRVGQTKYGGGIRVKKVEAYDYLTQKTTSNSYFYTNSKGTFLESWDNSSGSATCEPFPYIDVEDVEPGLPDPRIAVARGGLYTPAKVAYGMVQVAQNYSEAESTEQKKKPAGYTVYEYYTANDYPNGGTYGDIDMSWKRGFIKKVQVCNAEGKVLSETNPIYRWVPEEDAAISLRFSDGNAGWISTGRVEVIGSNEKKNGVQTSSSCFYATDGAAPQTDGIAFYSTQLAYKSSRIAVTPGSEGCAIAKTNATTNFNGPEEDIVIASMDNSGNGTFNVNLTIASDVVFGENVPTARVATRILPVASSVGDRQVLGVDVCFWDANQSPDILVQTTNGSNQAKWLILLNPTISSGVISGTLETRTVDLRTPLINNASGMCGTVCDIDNNGKIDVLCGIRVNGSNDMPLICYRDASDPDPQNREYWGARIENAVQLNIRHMASVSNNRVLVSYVNDDGHFIQGDAYSELAFKDDGMNFDSKFVLFYTLVSPGRWPPASWHETCWQISSKTLLVPYVEQQRKTIYESGWEFGGALWDGKSILSAVNGGFTVAKEIRGIVVRDCDGQPDQVVTKSPRSTYLVSTAIPYFYENTIIQNKNMLNLNARNTVFEVPASTTLPIDITAWNTNARKAGATRWKKIGEKYLPIATYAWKANMDQDGNLAAGESFTPFNFADGAINTSWFVVDSIGKYSQSAQPIEQIKHFSREKLVYGTTNLGHKVRIPVASISNAAFNEAGVFTGDYDLNQTGSDGVKYFDMENGWSKGLKDGGASTVFAGAKHFGEQGAAVLDAFGPTRAFKLQKGRDYVLSAWIQPVLPEGEILVPVEKGMVMNVTYRRSLDNGASWPIKVYPNSTSPTSTSEPELSSSGILNSKKYGDWYYVQLPVPAKKDISDAQWNNGYQYAVAWVGCPNGNGAGQSAIVYVDDIRFYPKDALVTTTYYDQKWYQPILSVDANNNPSQKVEYDELGRPVRWYKVNQKNPSNVTLLQTKEYHLLGDFEYPNPNKTYKILAEANENFYIESYNTIWTGGEYVRLYGDPDKVPMVWKFVPTPDGYYNIISDGLGGVSPSFVIAYDAIAGETELRIRLLSGATPSTDHKKWKLTNAGNGCCRISAKLDDAAYIDVRGGVLVDEAHLQIFRNGSNNKWKLVEW